MYYCQWFKVKENIILFSGLPSYVTITTRKYDKLRSSSNVHLPWWSANNVVILQYFSDSKRFRNDQKPDHITNGWCLRKSISFCKCRNLWCFPIYFIKLPIFPNKKIKNLWSQFMLKFVTFLSTRQKSI